MPNTISLETFDFLELLYLLCAQDRSGALQVFREDGQFSAWLDGGRIQALEFGEQRGVDALIRLLMEPRGRFHFQAGARLHQPPLNVSLDEVALAALDALPLPTPDLSGLLRVTEPERLRALPWTPQQQQILQQIQAGTPASALLTDPVARPLILKLHRVGLLAPRRLRVARLVVGVTRQTRGAALIDEVIYARWQDALGRAPQQIAVRDHAGQVRTLAVEPGVKLGAHLLLPPELLARSGLLGGVSVLVQPI